MALNIWKRSVFGIASFLLWSAANSAHAAPISPPDQKPKVCAEAAVDAPKVSLEQLRKKAHLVTGQYVLTGRYPMKQSMHSDGGTITTNTLPLTLLNLPNLLAGRTMEAEGILTEKDFPDLTEVSYQEALKDIAAYLDIAGRWALTKPITRWSGQALLEIASARHELLAETAKKDDDASRLWAIRSLCLTRNAIRHAQRNPDDYDLPRSFSYILRKSLTINAPDTIVKWSTLWLFEAVRVGVEGATNETILALDLMRAARSLPDPELEREILDWAKHCASEAPLISEGNIPERVFALGNLIDSLGRLEGPYAADDLQALLPRLQQALRDTPFGAGDEKLLTSYEEMIRMTRDRIKERRSN